jgi:DNA mismatch repair protein MutS2
VDDHALRVLEFDKVLARVAALASFPAGAELALALRPAAAFAEAVERQQALGEARRLRSAGAVLNLTSAIDVRPGVEKAALGGQLDPQDLLAVAATQRVAAQVKDAFRRLGSGFPILGALGAELAEAPQVVEQIAAAIDQRGEIVDSASPALAILRRDIRTAHDRLHAKLQEFLASRAGRLAAQEPFVTLRDGRYVVPIKADFRGEVRGIVHDVSASGATLFIEPLTVVNLANTWRELQIEEAREVERILRRLSALVGAVAGELSSNVALLARLDLLMASARLAEELSGPEQSCLPLGEEDASAWLAPAPADLRLVEARHPLLGAPVPISLELGGADCVLLITGPNTGGKTVALKTVGLLALMAQSGLPVPAERESRLPVFDAVLADIGDEQSIEQSLSTFSGHMKNIIAILAGAGPGSLVLLDELAAGTDPEEGAALARAILRHLLDLGCLTIATTHHGELKLFAHATPGVVNAAVEFDPLTLAPTYRITIGVPGRSNALAIAARLGLPEPIVQAARSSLSPEQAEIDSLLEELRRERDAAAEARRAEEQARRRAEEARVRAEARLATVDEEATQRLEGESFLLEQEVASAREALAAARRAVRRREAEMPPEELREAEVAVAAAGEAAVRLRRRARRRSRRRPGLAAEQVRPGYQVWLQGVPAPAEALSAPNARGEIEVSLGALRARVPIHQVVRVERPAPAVAPRVEPPAPARPVAEQIEVRGQTLDEALPKVEALLDAAFRAGVPRLRIVHGKGTGKMRRAVRDLLSRHPLVKAFDFAPPHEGGEGVTVVELSLA